MIVFCDVDRGMVMNAMDVRVLCCSHIRMIPATATACLPVATVLA